MTSTTEATAQVGVVGLAVMGRNLARNFANHGYVVAVYNRTAARTEEMMAEHASEGNFVPATELADFVASLESPRRIVIMVKDGSGTDATIDSLVTLLADGDNLVESDNVHSMYHRQLGAE